MNKSSVDCSSDTGYKPRQLWIDMLRGGCMLAILLDHTEIYYTGTNIIPYTLYVPNALCVFFFLSGYLFFKPQGFSLRAKLVSPVENSSRSSCSLSEHSVCPRVFPLLLNLISGKPTMPCRPLLSSMQAICIMRKKCFSTVSTPYHTPHYSFYYYYL